MFNFFEMEIESTRHSGRNEVEIRNPEEYLGANNLEGLENYRQLVINVDQRCGEIVLKYKPYIACERGCDDCCRHISVFPVEAVAISQALLQRSAAEIAKIRRRAASASPEGICPLLENGDCRLYADRPIICRTHGLPILINQDGHSRIDFCPKNFVGMQSLPGDAAIFLDRLNEALTMINRLFISRFLPDVSQSKRFLLAEALHLEIKR